MDIPELPLPTPHSKPEPPAGDDVTRKNEKAQPNQAADLIRQKLDALYKTEPSAQAEIKEIDRQDRPLSSHQAYMQKLSNSGRSIAEIQTAWHEYYEKLSDEGKREVWEEFYSQRQPETPQPIPAAKQPEKPEVHHESKETHTASRKSTLRHRRKRTIAEHKHQIARHSQAKQKLTAKHHFQSLIFGLAVGSFAVLLLLFGFFNERFIAPFITPSRQVNSTPIITDPGSTAAGTKPLVIIPKINVEIPVVYDESSIAEASMQKALERGVVHYATTPEPGQKGNVVIFGHSSNNIFNPGKYKFAFVLLSKLDNGDLFYLDKGGKRYVYKVYKKRVVEPTNISVLNTADKPDTATLITCDPPGTSLRRLVVTGEQISPAPASNKTNTAAKARSEPAILPSNSPSLWRRFLDWL